MKQSIDITNKDRVESSSTGRVTKVMWDPAESAARSEAIRQARKEALEEHQAYLATLNPTNQRIAELERKVALLMEQYNVSS